MIKTKTTSRNNIFTTIAIDTDTKVKLCECKVNVNPRTNTWTISSWYTKEGCGNRGYGKITLQACLDAINKSNHKPDEVEYIWNGVNEYVLKWLNKHFGAVSRCPLAIQKCQSDDDWESHIYILNKDKFLTYFHLN